MTPNDRPATDDDPGPDERLAEIRTQLYARVDSYHRTGMIGDRKGWDLWVLCARNAAWARLVANAWDRVAEHVPGGLLMNAAYNSVFHYDAERERWRSLANSVARDLAYGR